MRLFLLSIRLSVYFFQLFAILYSEVIFCIPWPVVPKTTIAFIAVVPNRVVFLFFLS